MSRRSTTCPETHPRSLCREDSVVCVLLAPVIWLPTSTGVEMTDTRLSQPSPTSSSGCSFAAESQILWAALSLAGQVVFGIYGQITIMQTNKQTKKNPVYGGLTSDIVVSAQGFWFQSFVSPYREVILLSVSGSYLFIWPIWVGETAPLWHPLWHHRLVLEFRAGNRLWPRLCLVLLLMELASATSSSPECSCMCLLPCSVYYSNTDVVFF